MARYIIDINHNDELPVVIRKCNENFRSIFNKKSSIDIDTTNIATIDYVQEAIQAACPVEGYSNGWYYQLYQSGWIHAYTVLDFDVSTIDFHIQTVPLPTRMLNTDYSVHVDGGVDSVERAYSITKNNTIDDVYICVYNDFVDSTNLTTKVAVVIDGYTDGSTPPSPGGDRLPDYMGVSIIIPSRIDQILPTENKSVLTDITVQRVPESLVDNEAGGRTYTILS